MYHAMDKHRHHRGMYRTQKADNAGVKSRRKGEKKFSLLNVHLDINALPNQQQETDRQTLSQLNFIFSDCCFFSYVRVERRMQELREMTRSVSHMCMHQVRGLSQFALCTLQPASARLNTKPHACSTPTDLSCN